MVMTVQSKRVAVAGLVFGAFAFVGGIGVGISLWMASDYFRAVVWYFLNRWGS